MRGGRDGEGGGSALLGEFELGLRCGDKEGDEFAAAVGDDDGGDATDFAAAAAAAAAAAFVDNLAAVKTLSTSTLSGSDPPSVLRSVLAPPALQLPSHFH